MEINDRNIFVQPLEIQKTVDSSNYIVVQKAYVVNQNLNDTQDQNRTSSGLSKLFDVSYIELSSNKKTLSVVLQQRSGSLESKKHSSKISESETGMSQKQQILSLIQKFRKMNDQNRSKGISVKNRVAKFSSEADTKLKLQKLCQQLDGQPFSIYRLGVDETRDITVLKQFVVSNTFYELCGRNISEEAVKISQTKVFQEFHTKFNYKKQIFHILSWCIKRMEMYSRGQEVEQKNTFIFQLDKELIMPDGMILKTKMNIYYANPMLYYVIEECKDPNPTQSQFVSVDDPLDSIEHKHTNTKHNKQSKQNKANDLFGMFQKEQPAGYKEINNRENKIQIITRVHKH